jgi:hypothetical protein
MLLEARTTKIIIVITWAIGLVLVIAYLCYLRSIRPLEQPFVPGPIDVQATNQTNARESSLPEELSLGRLLGENKPALPHMGMPVGRPPGEDDMPDLSTPAAAVYSVLSLIEQGATDKLPLCFIDETQGKGNNLYPSYLGQPMELVDVVIDGESALVIWNATVHTEFSLEGRNHSVGEKITLMTRLRRVEDFWKLLKLYDGVKDGSQ